MFFRLIQSILSKSSIPFRLSPCSNGCLPTRLLTHPMSTVSNTHQLLSLDCPHVQDVVSKHLEKSNQYQSEQLRTVVDAIKVKQAELKELDVMARDPELKEIARADAANIQLLLQDLTSQFFDLLLKGEDDPMEHNAGVVIEVSAGVGGQEAMLFSEEIFRMYQSFAVYKGWEFEVLSYAETELGGVRLASGSISGGNGIYSALKYEGGVHRVQRIPKTERSGRVHTSTATVAILPSPSAIEIDIPPSDLRIETKRSSGAGGQNVNKRESAVMITHIPTGIIVDSQTQRSQIQNRNAGLLMLRAKLYQRKLEQQREKLTSQRKLQVGTGLRNEKIRTYNYQQDRVTDHRIGLTLHNLPGILGSRKGSTSVITALTGLIKFPMAAEKSGTFVTGSAYTFIPAVNEVHVHRIILPPRNQTILHLKEINSQVLPPRSFSLSNGVFSLAVQNEFTFYIRLSGENTLNVTLGSTVHSTQVKVDEVRLLASPGMKDGGIYQSRNSETVLQKTSENTFQLSTGPATQSRYSAAELIWSEELKEIELLIHAHEIGKLSVAVHQPPVNPEPLTFATDFPENSHFAKYFKSETLSDVEIKAGEARYPAHRFVLAERSPVFQKMLEVNMTESRSRTIKIEDFDRCVVDEFLEFLYTGTSKNLKSVEDSEVLIELFRMADLYDVLPLKRLCEEFLRKILNVSNVVQIFQLAVLHSAKSLELESKQFFISNKKAIIPNAQALKDLFKTYSENLIYQLDFA